MRLRSFAKGKFSPHVPAMLFVGIPSKIIIIASLGIVLFVARRDFRYSFRAFRSSKDCRVGFPVARQTVASRTL